MHGTRADIQKSYGEGEVHESEAQTVGVCLRCRFQAAAGLHGHLKVQRVQRQRYHANTAGSAAFPVSNSFAGNVQFFCKCVLGQVTLFPHSRETVTEVGIGHIQTPAFLKISIVMPERTTPPTD